MAKFRKSHEDWCKKVGESYLYICKGCDETHLVYTEKPRLENTTHWKYNGDINNPTLSPSVVVKTEYNDGRPNRVCHHFIRDGKIQYLNDCTHQYAGQTIEIPDYDEVFGEK